MKKDHVGELQQGQDSSKSAETGAIQKVVRQSRTQEKIEGINI